ncbi:helix-turn-helix domain-containing protein [Ligilactobacillus animalis]|uniref:helix-turn-helix domain-containing protein n=1 Tax=Ligilactobacillus animalis TaxID=1605 RepID=UPI00266BD429|nr:helix-turn-helix transcriptional regulator [Ligilactobacillus animalis]
MSIYQRIKDLAQAKNISIRELEKQLTFSNGAINKWKEKAPSDKLEKVADYFGVTTDYLLGRTKDPVKTLDQEINEALDYSVGYSGKPITDNDREIIRGMIEAYIKNKKR